MKIIGGLQPTPIDERDFNLGSITLLPDLSELPSEFMLTAKIKDQGNTDLCSAYVTCTMSETQEEGVELSPQWSFAVSKMISGDIDSWGQNLRDALKVHTKYGAIPAEKSIDERDINKWPDYFELAKAYKKQTFFKIFGQYDHFDDARASLWKFKTAIATGVFFGWSLDEDILDTIPENGFGHAITVVGFEEKDGKEVLVIHNSYGLSVGDDGYHYMTRDIYNFFVDVFGQWIFVDMPKEKAKWMLDNNLKIEDNWLIQLFKIFLRFLQSYK